MVTREEVFRIIESLESEGIPFNVKAAEVLRQTWAERVEFECELHDANFKRDGFKAELEMQDREIDQLKFHTGAPEDMGRRFIDAWKRADRGEEVDESHLTFQGKQELLIYLLREHGIGIASLDETKARTIAIARGELKLPPDEPKLWFSSIEAMVEALQRCYFGSPSEDF